MASLRYSCSCTRYLSPTRLGNSVLPDGRCASPIRWHSAPTSPSNKRYRSQSLATRFRGVSTSSDPDTQQKTEELSTHTNTTKLAQVLQNKLFNLKFNAYNSIANNMKDVQQWTSERAPKLDAKSVAKLIATLNIDLPRYQRLISWSSRSLTSSHDSEIERVKRQQMEEKRAKLLERTTGEDVSRECHNFEQAMMNTQESIQTYYSNINQNVPKEVSVSPVEAVQKDPAGTVTLSSEVHTSTFTQATLVKQVSNLAKVLPSSNKTNPDKINQETAKGNLIVRGTIDRRTRGLMLALKKATTNASRLIRLETLCDHLIQYPEMGKNVAAKVRKIVSCQRSKTHTHVSKSIMCQISRCLQLNIFNVSVLS